MKKFKDVCKEKLTIGQQTFQYYQIRKVTDFFQVQVKSLPYTIRILLESLIRQEDGIDISQKHIENLAKWTGERAEGEIPFKPARVILQDFTGVPAVVDLASMREAIVKLGGEPEQINPEIPVDLVIDHSVQVDKYGSKVALEKNMTLEFERNKERYEFLKWAQYAFDNYRVVPPATGIVHQVNLEYLSDVVRCKEIDGETILLPDSLVGTDSHTTMINGLGVLGWGVGGIEAEAGMLGEPSYFPTPEVVGVKLTGKLAYGATATDLALKVTEVLRKQNVVGKFVEYFGEGITSLTLADRATIANMAPEYGATCGYFPVDEETLAYLKLTGRPDDTIERVEAYLKENDLFYCPETEPDFTKIVEIDLSKIEANLAGPKRPQDLIPLSNMKETFEKTVIAPEGNQGFGLSEKEMEKQVAVKFEDGEEILKTGDVAIAAITSCTNTSNPHVMIAAGLLAKNAVEKGLTVSKKVKTSLAPGSKVVTAYLEEAGLMPYLSKLGFDVVGYGCTTCIGNSGPLQEEVEMAIKENDMLVASVLSGNRNFEGRIHPYVKANYLSSPPLVVAYALAGTITRDLTKEPIGISSQGKEVYLNDIWPEESEIAAYIEKNVTKELFQEYYQKVFDSNETWNQIETEKEAIYHWDNDSTYIANPPFFDGMTAEISERKNLNQLRVLAKFGDSVTTDHISPAGAIGIKSTAGAYLQAQGVKPKDFNSFGSRRGNHEVMMRGTFGNVRLRNQIAPQGKEGAYTTYWPTEETLSIYDSAMNYQEQGTGLVVLAGADYGMGSSRDWAAKGTRLLGVEAVIAKSYERIHRSNLVMMGVLPLQFKAGEDAASLGLTGKERLSIQLPEKIGIQEEVIVTAETDGKVSTFKVIVRFDALADIRYYQHQGILPMVIRKRLNEKI